MCDIALRPKIHCMTSVHSIWGTCRFLGTTMLIFRKFIKIATFFVYKSSSYDAQIKRYLTLKFSLRPQKCTIFTYWGLPKPTVRLFGTHCKWFFGSQSQKLHFFTHFGVPNRALLVPDNGNKCCVCCVKKQQMLPKFSFSESSRSQLSNAVFGISSRQLVKKRQ